MRILFIGDIVGRSGRTIVRQRVPDLVRAWKLDFVAANGENAAGGFGITEAIYDEFVDAGIDVITGGNHSWDQREALVFIERAPKLLRPANFPAGTPGRGAAVLNARSGARVLVVNAMGRIFMDPLDDPFASLEAMLAQHRHLSQCNKMPRVNSRSGSPALWRRARVQHTINHLARKTEIVRRIAMATNGVHASKRLDDFRHASKNIGEISVALDGLATCRIDDVVRMLTAELGRDRHHDRLGDDQTARQIEIFAHPLFVHHETGEHEFGVRK